MNKAFVLAVALVLAFVPARQSRADANSDHAERAVVMMEQIATIVDANKASCDTMADKLNGYFDKNGAELKELNAAGKNLTAEQKKAFSEKYADRMKAVMGKMAPGMKACKDNAKVKAAMSKLMSR